MNDNDQLKKTTANSTASKSSLSGKRRALLKGSAAVVPAVFTLKSGAAFAAGSTGSCVTRDSAQATVEINNGTLEILQNSQDTWLRKEVPCRTLDDGVTTPFLIYIDDILKQNDTVDWRDGVTKTDRYEETGTDIPPKWKKRGSAAPPAPLYTISPAIDQPANTCFVLVQVDQNGNVVALGPTSDGTTPFVMGSCWTSISGATP